MAQPASAARSRPSASDSERWLPRLLPYLEQDSLNRNWNSTLSWKDPANASVVQTQVKVYLCPSNRASGTLDLQALGTFLGVALPNPAGTDYLLNKGSNGNLCPFTMLPTEVKGVFDINSAVRIQDITDGTSSTLVAGERPPSGSSRAAPVAAAPVIKPRREMLCILPLPRPSAQLTETSTIDRRSQRLCHPFSRRFDAAPREGDQP